MRHQDLSRAPIAVPHPLGFIEALGIAGKTPFLSHEALAELASAAAPPDNVVPFGAAGRAGGPTREQPAPVLSRELLRAVLGALLPASRMSFHVLAVVSGLTHAEVRAAVAALVAAGHASLEERPDGYEPRQMVRITDRGRGLLAEGVPHAGTKDAGDGQ